METNPLLAGRLYSAAQKATRPAPRDGASGSPAPKLAAAAADFTATLRAGEETAAAALTGKADMPALVEALARSELAVETAVTVRDKVVEAYQEILRMPV